ncbi:hypothetical protein EGW08_012509, partial [Elysia chlorotica]
MFFTAEKKKDGVDRSCENDIELESYQYQDSKSFLKCLLLKPVHETGVVGEGHDESCSADGTQINTAMPVDKIQSKMVNEQNQSEVISKVQAEQNLNINESKQHTLDLKVETEKNHGEALLPVKDSLSHQIAKVAKRRPFVFCNKNYLTKDKYIFRDGNTKPELHFHDSEEPFPTTPRTSDNGNRRFDRLIKRLKDGEQKLNKDLKDSQILKCSILSKEEPKNSTKRAKENLRVREKKKYESLINYERDQWQAHKKAFQELLPEKIDQVAANVEKQLEMIKPQKRRGRPPKKSDELKAVKGRKKKGEESSTLKKNVTVLKKQFSTSKSVKEVIDNSSKRENFRIEIVNKNGSEQVIELNGEEMNLQSSKLSKASEGKNCCKKTKGKDKSVKDMDAPEKTNSSLKVRRSTNKNGALPQTGENLTSNEAVSSVGLGRKPQKNVKHQACPATFTLPSVSSLEKDYELVSLSPNSSPKHGNFKTDQFFIPQYTFNKQGKTGMIMVGPFRLTTEPSPHLELVPPGGPQNRKSMILQRKVHSPSNTPPRDFRIRQDKRQGGAPCRPRPEVNPHDIQVTLLDHSYMTPPEQWDKVKRYSKTVAKQSANAEFIDARVENIEQAKDNVLVTIKGDNMLKMVDQLSDPAQAPTKTSKDGIPLVYTLDQIMTPALQKAADRKKREKLGTLT